MFKPSFDGVLLACKCAFGSARGRAVKYCFGKWLDEKVRRIWLHQAPLCVGFLRLRGGKKGGESYGLFEEIKIHPLNPP